jgi:undecaprenyl diphosphate synthase
MVTPLNHLAIIMDGNARWAAQNQLPKLEGHRNGVENIKKLLPIVMKQDISYLTLYGFSYENWKRSNEEVSYLLDLLGYHLTQTLSLLHENNIRLKVIGRLGRLSSSLQKRINDVVEATKENNKMVLCVAFSYGGRIEVLDACQKIVDSGKMVITEDNFRNYLYDADMPDVDLLIRTSGEQRISNFLLWQSAYAELYFSPKYWPDFNETDLMRAIDEYSKRKRNFGVR